MKNAQYYLNLPYEIIVFSDNEGGFMAKFKEFEDKAVLFGTGASESEAIKDLKAAFPSLIESMLKSKDYIPEPTSIKDNTKPVTITMKESLIKEITHYANSLGISKSAFLALSAKQFMKTL